jgi:hypothetical protein
MQKLVFVWFHTKKYQNISDIMFYWWADKKYIFKVYLNVSDSRQMNMIYWLYMLTYFLVLERNYIKKLFSGIEV